MVDQDPWGDDMISDPWGDALEEELKAPNKQRGFGQMSLLGNAPQHASSQKISIPKAPAYDVQQNKQDEQFTDDYSNFYKQSDKKYPDYHKNVYKPPEKQYMDSRKSNYKPYEKNYTDDRKHVYKPYEKNYTDDRKNNYKHYEKNYTDDRKNNYKHYEKNYTDDRKNNYKHYEKNYTDDRKNNYKPYEKNYTDDYKNTYKPYDKKYEDDFKNTYQPPERTHTNNRYTRNNRGRNFQGTSRESRVTPQSSPTKNSYISIEGLGEMFPDIPYGVLKEKFNLFRNDPDRLLAEVEAYKQNSVDDSDISKFYKTKPCPLKEECNNPHCFNYHYKGEMRRRYDIKKYKPILCQAAGHCKYGNECYYAHTISEVLYHPSRYQALNCCFKDASNKCMLGKYCAFNHYLREEEHKEEKKDEIEVIVENVENDTKNTSHIHLEKEVKENGVDREERTIEEIEDSIRAKEELKRTLRGKIYCNKCNQTWPKCIESNCLKDN